MKGGLRERTDRFFGNFLWTDYFPNYSVLHLPRIYSDHRLIMLHLENDTQPQSRAPFRFLNPWVTHESFEGMVRDSWCLKADLVSAIKLFTKKAAQWNVGTFRHIEGRKKKSLFEIGVVQITLNQGANDEFIGVEASLIWELETMLAQEEILWNQKARQDWALLGDRNLTFFDKKTKARNFRNRVEMLKLNGDT